MAQTDEEKAAAEAKKAEDKALAEGAKEDADEHAVAASVAPDGEGTTKDYQIEHGKAPIAPGPEKPVSEEDAAAAKANRAQGKGG